MMRRRVKLATLVAGLATAFLFVATLPGFAAEGGLP